MTEVVVVPLLRPEQRITVRAAGWQRGGTGVQRGRFESVSGDIRFEGELGRGGVVQVESQSGKIEVRSCPP